MNDFDFKTLSLDTRGGNAESIMGCPARITRYLLTNKSKQPLYVKFFDGKGMGQDAVKVGKTKPAFTIAVPAGKTVGMANKPDPFIVGISIACTTGPGDDDAGDPGAGELEAHVQGEFPDPDTGN